MMAEVVQSPPLIPTLSAVDFHYFQKFIYEHAGIDLSPAKRALVQSRLARRLRELQLPSYAAYWQYLNQDGHADERQRAINMLSTNETYFFREPDHFQWLAAAIKHRAAQGKPPLRIWSAACSTGEEPYTIAMVMAEILGLDTPWTILATDINTRVLETARRAVYPLARVSKTPAHLWTRFFLRGQAEYEGSVRVRRELASRVQFEHLNLQHCSRWTQSDFDVVLLRNVLIYFDEKTKKQILEPLCRKIRPGGYLLVGHSEVIRKLDLPLEQEVPSRYRRTGAVAGDRRRAT